MSDNVQDSRGQSYRGGGLGLLFTIGRLFGFKGILVAGVIGVALWQTSAQRMRWFNKGLSKGTIDGGDTFAMAYKDL